MKKIYLSIFVSLGFAMIFSACTKLDEPLYDRLSADSFYKTPGEIQAGVADIYNSMNNGAHYWWQTMEMQDETTDHGICPWNDNGDHWNAHLHKWVPTWGVLNDVYSSEYSTIAKANLFLEVLKGATLSDSLAVKAEVKALRAYCYMELMDYFGGVPIVTAAKLNPQNLPARNTRAEVFDFIEKEFKDAITNLPSATTQPYPRIGKESVQAMLAKLYLNAEVWSGTPRWADCVAQCDAVISSGAYTLPSGYGDIWKAFGEDNNTSANNKEIIFALSKDQNGAQLFTGLMSFPDGARVNGAVNADGTVIGFKGGPNSTVNNGGWDGPSTTLDHYNIYDPSDFRRQLIMNGKYYDAAGNFLSEFKPYTGSDLSQLSTFVSTPTVDWGLKVIKYRPNPSSTNGGWMSNDLVLMRYADILLSKAEALYRTSAANKAAAEALVNQVHARNFKLPQTITINSLDDILMERSKEFLWEGTYRTDLIRFGKFGSWTGQFKTTPDADGHLTLFPIPQPQLQTNVNLVQNPGY